MSSMQLLKDNEGQSYIPPSQRPDGTWRKPIRVRDGYVPQEEQPVYVSKGRQFTQDRSQCPVGLTPSDLESFKSGSSGGFPITYFEVGNYKPTAAIPGLNFVESSDSLAPAGKTKSKKGKSKGKGADDSAAGNQGKGQATAVAASTGGGGAASTKSSSNNTNASSTATSQQQVDPAKRLRNLKKRLKEIEELEKRISSGELSSPEKEQLEKLKRKDEVEDEIEDLERLVSKLNVS